jgi:DNA-binding CsgD family transcriptional regulator
MNEVIRDMTSHELVLFGELVGMLEACSQDADPRAAILEQVAVLMRAEFAASCIWSEQSASFGDQLGYNMDSTNLKRYEEWYQFHDPITGELKRRGEATVVDEVLDRSELERTEFFNDFLSHDGLHYGVNIFLVENGRDLGDLRIWRRRSGSNFGERDLVLLNVIGRFLRAALARRASPLPRLTPRECQVADLVARGCTDRDIARILGIGFGTVRTHLNKALEKRHCANRAELAVSVMRGASFGSRIKPAASIGVSESIGKDRST